MENGVDVLRAAFIPPAGLASEDSWDAALLLRSRIRTGAILMRREPLSAIAEVFEGERLGTSSHKLKSGRVYGAGSIAPFELRPTSEHWLSAARFSPTSLRPTDVAVKRIAPIVAAFVPAGLPALPTDGSFLVIRGLSETDAWWVVHCLNHPMYADYLLSKSGRGILSRISLGVLRGWLIPQPPVGFSNVARRLSEILAKRTFLAGQIAALRADVEARVADQLAATGYEQSEKDFGRPSWSFTFPASLTDASWLPLHVATAYRTEALHRDCEWEPLPDRLLLSAPLRVRVSGFDEAIPVLRLGDVGEIPLVPASLKASVPTQAHRVFAEPIQPDEVLLSTLTTNPRVAFSPVPLHPPVHAADLWERLRFRSHAAAFALILQTGAVRRQLNSLASGTVQQFIRPEDVRRLFLPVLNDETLTNWDRSLRSLGKSWLQTEADWLASLQEGSQAFRSSSN